MTNRSGRAYWRGRAIAKVFALLTLALSQGFKPLAGNATGAAHSSLISPLVLITSAQHFRPSEIKRCSLPFVRF